MRSYCSFIVSKPWTLFFSFQSLVYTSVCCVRVYLTHLPVSEVTLGWTDCGLAHPSMDGRLGCVWMSARIDTTMITGLLQISVGTCEVFYGAKPRHGNTASWAQTSKRPADIASWPSETPCLKSPPPVCVHVLTPWPILDVSNLCNLSFGPCFLFPSLSMRLCKFSRLLASCASLMGLDKALEHASPLWVLSPHILE